MRVNVVRNAWKITHPNAFQARSFYDSSLWESRKLDGDESLKRLIREGVEHTSAVCVLTGADTWSRRWVRYEIARAIIDGRGLLSVHLNNIRHHKTLMMAPRGTNPLAMMAVGKIQPGALGPIRYFLFERLPISTDAGWQWQWHPYQDHSAPVALPRWLADPAPGHVTPFSNNADEYDYIAQEGGKNIGAWIDRAAQRAGR
jgi:hypothetical protein